MTIAERIILICNSAENGNMSSFARKLNVTPAYISKLKNKPDSEPSSIFIKEICRQYGINENWIISGEGNMYNNLSRKEQIAAFFADVLTDPEDSFRVQFIDALSRMTVEDWDYIGDMMKRITKKEES